MTKIQYENLTIRQAEVADAKQLAAWWNDGAVMAHAGFPNGLGTTEEEIIERLEQSKANQLFWTHSYLSTPQPKARVSL
mgnify:CR=1 FL=1